MIPLQTLGDLWDRNTHLFPQVEAIVYGPVRRTYREVSDRGRRLASVLHSMGAVSQDRISMLARNRAEWFDYYAACEIYGFVAATLNFRLSAEELAYVLADSGASILIFEAEYTPLIDTLRSRLPAIRNFLCIGDCPTWASPYEQFLEAADPVGPATRAKPSDMVRLIYTSGTTGRPKGVVRDQTADLALARCCATTSDMAAGCRELIMMPMFHIGAQSMASGAQWAGGTVVLHRDFDPQAILRDISAERIQVLHVTPTIVQSIIDHPQLQNFDLSSLQTVLYAAAPMPVPLLTRGLERLGKIFTNCYGSTESGASITLQKRFHLPDNSPHSIQLIGSLGQEHQDSQVRIVDPKGSPCPTGTRGEIAVRCTSMMRGYWNNKDATAAAFSDGWLLTGDIGHMDSEGFVYLVDRKADMIITGGENVYSREVENALLLHESVKAVAVIGMKDDHWGEAIKAIVVCHPNTVVSADDLISHCKLHIARYKAPKTVEFVETLPLLPSAKIDKVTLRRLYGGS